MYIKLLVQPKVSKVVLYMYVGDKLRNTHHPWPWPSRNIQLSRGRQKAFFGLYLLYGKRTLRLTEIYFYQLKILTGFFLFSTFLCTLYPINENCHELGVKVMSFANVYGLSSKGLKGSQDIAHFTP